jgi:hypothetical protein
LRSISNYELAGRYFLRQGLFYPELLFIGMVSPATKPYAGARVPRVTGIKKESQAKRVALASVGTGLLRPENHRPFFLKQMKNLQSN